EVEHRIARADAKVRLNGPAAIEVVEKIGHRRPDFGFFAGEKVGLVIAERHLAFEAEAVHEAVADTDVSHPIFFESEVGAVNGDVAVDRVADIESSVPAFLCVRRTRGARSDQRSDCYGSHQFRYHGASP